MLESLSNFFDWLKQIEREFLHESYTHINMHIMAYKFEEEKYIITHFKLQFFSKRIGTPRWHYSIHEKAVFIDHWIKIDELLEMFATNDDGLLLKISNLELTFNKNLNLPPSYESYLKMVKTPHGEYLGYRSSSLMSFLYLNYLYNNDGSFIEYNPKETQIKYPILLSDYTKQIFIKDGDILKGNEIIDEVFGTSNLNFIVPILIIEYPIESFKFRSNGKIIANKFKIKIEWDIKKDYKKLIDVNYFVKEKKYPVTFKNFRIEEKFTDEFLIIDFIIWWKGDSRLVAKDSRVFWRFFNSLHYISDIKERIRDYKRNVREIRENLRIESANNKEKMKDYIRISKIYGKIAGEFRYLSNSSMIDFTRKSWLYQRLEGKYYAKFLSIYKNQISVKDQNIQDYLWLATILFRNFKQVKDFVFREERRRLIKATHYSYVGASPHFQINEIYYILNDANKIIQERLEIGIQKHEYYTLLDNFEILGDLHIHMGLLEFISDDGDFHFRIKHIDLNIAMKCYEKALKYKNKTEIPGIGRLSIYVSNYMPIFHKFIENSYLEKKIEYLQNILEPPKGHFFPTPEGEPQNLHETIDTLIEEIYLKSNKIGISKTDIILFLDQFKENDLKRAMAILLRKTKYRTIQEIVDDLIKLIKMKVRDFENTILVYFPDMELKSNSFITQLVSKMENHKFGAIVLNRLLSELENLDNQRNYDIVFLDDVIGTGRQFIRTFNKVLGEQLEEIELKLKKFPNIKFSLFASFGSINSISLISQKLPFFKIDNILYANPIRKEDKAFSSNPYIPEIVMERLIKFLKNSDNDYWNGMYKSEFLVLLDYSTPNNSIGCFWRKEGEINPLWKRTHY